MAVNNNAAEDIYKILKAHLPNKDKRGDLLEALFKVEANVSFKTSIAKVIACHKADDKKK